MKARGKPFQPGQSGNPNGKPKGAISKINREVREMIHTFLSDNYTEFQVRMAKLNDATYCRLYIKAAEMILPKNMNLSLKEDIQVTIPMDPVPKHILAQYPNDN